MNPFEFSRTEWTLRVIPHIPTMREDPQVIFLGESPKITASNFTSESVCVTGPIALNARTICKWHGEVFYKLRAGGFQGNIYMPERRTFSLPEKELSNVEITAWKMRSLSEATHSIFWYPDLFSEQGPGAHIELCFALGKLSHNGAAQKIHIGRPGKKLKNVQVQDWLAIKEIAIHNDLKALCAALLSSHLGR